MSLLIDALRQAEQARARAESASPEEDLTRFALEPLPDEAHVADLTPVTPPPAAAISVDEKPEQKPTHTVRQAMRQQAARELFGVKPPAPSKLPILIAALVLVTLLVGGAYLWWGLQPRGMQTGPAFATAVRTPAITSTPPLVANKNTPVMPEQSTRPPAAATDEIRNSAGVSVVSPVQTRSSPNKLALSNTPPREAQPTGGPDGLKLRQGTKQPEVASNPLNLAYQAYTSGDLAQAKQLYREALRAHPRNTDALNGLGTIARREGDTTNSRRYFLASLEADPTDAFAASQLALLQTSNLGDAEATARSLVTAQPKSAAAHFALGNILSRQGRWGDAQQSYFQALTFDPENPDIQFNLAVSLDHLAQPVLARQFYDRALAASTKRPAHFSPEAARQRLQALSGANATP